MKRDPWAAGVFLLTAFFAFYPVTDTDIWWHLSAAREMLSRHALLYADPFSYTPSAIPWLNLHWLYQLMVYGVHHATGLYGLILLKSLFFGVAAAILFLSSPGGNRRFMRFFLFGLFVFQVRYLMLDRPVMVTILGMSAFLYALEKFRNTGRLVFLLLLVPLQVLWVNAQGLSAIGIVISACFLTEALLERSPRAKILALFTTALFFCGLANPYGLQGALLPLRLFHRLGPSLHNLYSMNISENIPLRYVLPADFHFVLTTLLLAAVVITSVFLNQRKLRWAHLFLFSGFSVLAFMAMRNVLLFEFAGLFIVNDNLALAGPARQRPLFIRLGTMTAAALLLTVCFSHGKMLTGCRGLNGLSPFRVPTGAVEYLKAHPIPGRCFNGDRYGGYIEWTLYPAEKVFIDGRFIIKPTDVFVDYFSALDTPSVFFRLADKYGITHALLPIAVFDRHLKLARALYRSNGWELLYIDGSSVLFARQGSGTTAPIRLDSQEDRDKVETRIRDQWKANPAIAQETLKYLEIFKKMCEEEKTVLIIFPDAKV